MNRQEEERLLPAERKGHSGLVAPWPKFIPVLPGPLGGEWGRYYTNHPFWVGGTQGSLNELPSTLMNTNVFLRCKTCIHFNRLCMAETGVLLILVNQPVSAQGKTQREATCHTKAHWWLCLILLGAFRWASRGWIKKLTWRVEDGSLVTRPCSCGGPKFGF